MPEKSATVEVSIAGAGPVGLLLANECARRGLVWRLVEARASQSEHSKALAIFPRTLEILDMAGLVSPFLETANPVTSVAVVTQTSTLARLRFQPEEESVPFYRYGSSGCYGATARAAVATAAFIIARSRNCGSGACS
jgi:2-polyprenyl-6-methoxyphenol hydroxylase-like FAD-dependent oxidoreductase